MKTKTTIYTEQIDDTLLLYGLLQKMGLQSIVDKVMQPHGNRQGLGIGWTINIWLIHILREKNHCMDVVQNWSVKQLTGQSIVELDFTDDRLADTLRHLSDDERWLITTQARSNSYPARISCLRLSLGVPFCEACG